MLPWCPPAAFDNLAQQAASRELLRRASHLCAQGVQCETFGDFEKVGFVSEHDLEHASSPTPNVPRSQALWEILDGLHGEGPQYGLSFSASEREKYRFICIESLSQSLLSQPGSWRGQCTKQWARGAYAYRCYTCQTGNSSAVCETCFKVCWYVLYVQIV